MDKSVPSGEIQGELTPPCSKSYAQRALAASLLAEGTSRLHNIEFCDDTRSAIRCIRDAEPIGPKKLLDALVIAPCTGNTLAKLSGGVTDSTVTLAAKAHLRNGRPVLLAIASNDALAGNAENIGRLLARKHYYFVPFGQDDPEGKPCSLVADMNQLRPALEAALQGRQLQPLLLYT